MVCKISGMIFEELVDHIFAINYIYIYMGHLTKGGGGRIGGRGYGKLYSIGRKIFGGPEHFLQSFYGISGHFMTYFSDFGILELFAFFITNHLPATLPGNPKNRSKGVKK